MTKAGMSVFLSVSDPEIDQLVFRGGLDRLIAAVTREAEHWLPSSRTCLPCTDGSGGRHMLFACRLSQSRLSQNRWARSRSALLMTLTEDSAIAAAAMTGERSRPKAG